MRKFILLFIVSIVFISGCSNKPAETTVQKQSPTKSSQSNKPATPLNAEQILMKAPGRFAGANYDEQKVQAALDQLPENLTADQYMDQLLSLLAEDYRSYVTTFVNFETEVKVNNQRPNGKIALPDSKKLHISILLDASGSMKAQINGKTKMDSAKEAIQSFGERLPQNAQVSLRLYGHKGTGSQKDKQLSCSSTEEVFSGQGSQTNQLKTVLQGVKPAGWTPIASALESVKKDINPETTDSIVYVVSDGIETCGGNPAQVARELNQSKVKTVVNIIGFDVNNEGQKLLRQVAVAGGGEFTSINSDQALQNYMKNEYVKLQGEWTKWKEKGAGQANTQTIKKQGALNIARETMVGLTNLENTHLQAADSYLRNKRGDAYPISDLHKLITDRHSFAWDYANDTGTRLYNLVKDSGDKVYDDITKEGEKNINKAIEKQNQQ
jgi:Ca-activated chloride channel family protein